MNHKEKLSATEFLSAFLIRYKVTLIVFLALIAVLLIGISVGAVLSQKSNIKNIIIAESILDLYSEFENANDDEKENARLKLNDAISQGKNTKIGSYAFVRATMIESQILEDEDKKTEALSILSSLKDVKSNLYLIPIALHRAAVISEELGQLEDALSYYRAIEKNYSKDYFGMDRIYFNIARLEESLERLESAKNAYKKLIASENNSEENEKSPFVSIAKDRLIYLENESNNEGTKN